MSEQLIGWCCIDRFELAAVIGEVPHAIRSELGGAPRPRERLEAGYSQYWKAVDKMFTIIRLQECSHANRLPGFAGRKNR